MKIKPNEIAGLLNTPPAHVVAWLCYGPDEGKANEFANTLYKNLRGIGASNPQTGIDMSGIRLQAADIHSEPSRFYNEAMGISMFGEQTIIRIQGTKDSHGLEAIMRDYLPKASADTRIIIEAGDLPPRSKLRQLFEEAGQNNLIPLPCYVDDERDIAQMARQQITAQNLSIDGDALQLLVSKLGIDRSISRGEIDKLCLYKAHATKGSPEATITLSDVEILLGDSAQITLQAVLNACFSGDIAKFEQQLTLLWREGTSPISLIRAASAHLLRLQQYNLFLREGKDASSALRSMNIFFKQQASFQAQARLWTLKKTYQALGRLSLAEGHCMRSSKLAPTTVHRTLMSFAFAAKKRGS